MIKSLSPPVQVVGIDPAPVGKRYTIHLIVGIIGFVTGVVIFVTSAFFGFFSQMASALSQSESDGNVFILWMYGGCLFMLCSLIPIAIGLNGNKKPVQIVQVQE